MGNPTQSTSLNGPDSRRGEMAQAFQNFQHCVQRCQKAVFFTDAAGVLQRVNPAFEQLTGYTSTECVGRDLSWLASAGPISKAYKRIWQEIFDNRTFRGVLEVRRKDGSSFEMELTAIPVRDSKGQITSLVCTGQDFREEREMETQLREARRLNAVSVLPRAFAHDLNNLLMVITGCAELALDALPQDSPVSRNLQEIRTASQRASELSREMLSLGSVGTQNLAPVCVNSVIQETSRILSRVIGPRIQLQVVLGDDINPTVADVRQLQQVLLNLAISARNAMPESGKFVLQTRTLEVDCSPLTDGGLPPGKYAQLSVSVENFDVGSEGLATISGLLAEIGMGKWIRDSELAIVEEIVKENHGFLFVDGNSGENTVVNIYLPVAHAQARVAESSPAEQTSSRPRETLLIVEDESVIRTALAEFLSGAGYKVLCARNGKEALGKIHASPDTVDLVITDVVMPQMSGPKLAEQLASIHPKIKILFVSGCSEDVSLSEAAACPPRNFLLKPFSFQMLAEKVRQVLCQPGIADAAAAGKD